MNSDKRTGLEILKTILDTGLKGPDMGKTLPMKLLEISEGRAVFSGLPNENHTNVMGVVHGGFIATVIDSATGCAVHSTLPAGESYGTVDLQVKMMRPLQVGHKVIATGTVINKSRNLVIATCEVKNEAGKLMGYGNCTCMIIRPKGI